MSLRKSGDDELDSAVNEWLERDKNPVTRQDVEFCIGYGLWDELRAMLLQRQKFGTAGFRSRMRAGYIHMNDVVVLQTAQGLCTYLKKECNPQQLQAGLVVGYDGRHNSKRFAELTAKVFVSNSIPVHLFSKVCPTPFVSFATIHYGACAGVMVTASHHSKKDNGYKVYWGNGCQIIPPHDDNICEEILHCLDIPDDHWNIDEIRTHPLVSDCLEEITTKYMEYIRGSLPENVLEQNRKANIDIVYSAIHGVGHDYVLKAFEAANLKPPITVPEQREPDPDFPTTKFMFFNPEQFACFDYGCHLAGQSGARLVLVTDPDANRLAVAELDRRYDKWTHFTGNEIGALLGWWMLEQNSSSSSSSSGDGDVCVVSSIVSSQLLKALVKDRGIQYVETHAGFKWIGLTCLSLQKKGVRPLFAFEDAQGYMTNVALPDKDGVSAAVQVASLASKLYASNSSLRRQLDELYDTYGYHVTRESYYLYDDPAVISKVYEGIRNWDGQVGKYPTRVGSFDITYIHDFSAGVQIPEDAPVESKFKPVSRENGPDSVSEITFKCSNGMRVVIRHSGTQPRLKTYSELVGEAGTHQGRHKMWLQLGNMQREFLKELLQTEKYGLM